MTEGNLTFDEMSYNIGCASANLKKILKWYNRNMKMHRWIIASIDFENSLNIRWLFTNFYQPLQSF